MTIQRAEALKRQWTDQIVQVQSSQPELRRFQGLVGTVKTVNMNCRLLIQFDTPADISWYDIAPEFAQVITAEQANAMKADTAAESESAAGSPPSQSTSTASKATTAAKSSTPTDSPKPVSPLDQIRAASGGPGSTSVPPAAAASPLDAIRQQNAASDGPAKNTANEASPPDSSTTPSTGGGSPLDQIRAQAASADATSIQKSGTQTDGDKGATSNQQTSATTLSPLEQIRTASGATTASVATPSDTQQHSNAENASESGDALPGSVPESPSGDTNSPTSSAVSTAASESNDAASSDAASTSATTFTSSIPAPATPPAAETTVTSDQNPMAQVSEQAGEVSGDSRFEQVRRQAAADDHISETDDGSHSDRSADAGDEDPVKSLFRGKKLPKQDDLKIVEGIGPKIEQLLHTDGITTWQQLSEADPSRLSRILHDAGPRFRMHSPETWPNQARLAASGEWRELEEYQDMLHGGRDPHTK